MSLSSARRISNPGERLELSDPGWPFYRAVHQLTKVWKAKNRSKSAAAILFRAQTLGRRMLENGVGPDLEKIGKRRADPVRYVAEVNRHVNGTAVYRYTDNGLSDFDRNSIRESSFDWWIELKVDYNGYDHDDLYDHGYPIIRVHDMATSDVWIFELDQHSTTYAHYFNYIDQLAGGVYWNRRLHRRLKYSDFLLAGEYLLCRVHLLRTMAVQWPVIICFIVLS